MCRKIYVPESFFEINIVADLEIKPIFIQKEAPALVFSWQLTESFNKDIFNTAPWKKALSLETWFRYLLQI